MLSVRGHASSSKRFALVAGLGGSSVVALICCASSADAANRRVPTTTAAQRRASATPTKNTLAPKTLAEAVRVAATPLASSLGATIGPASCPSGTPERTGVVAQCMVGFEQTSVPFLVHSDGTGTLTASPTFPVLRTDDVERRAAVALGAAVRCGRATVVVLPPGASLGCTKGGTPIELVVDALGSVSARR